LNHITITALTGSRGQPHVCRGCGLAAAEPSRDRRLPPERRPEKGILEPIQQPLNLCAATTLACSEASFLMQSWRLQEILRLANIGFRSVGAYALRKRKLTPRRELAPTRVKKTWPLAAWSSGRVTR
jgi:hypothetical protein